MIARSFSLWTLLFVTSTAFRSPFLRSLRDKVSNTRVSSTVVSPQSPIATTTPVAPAVPSASSQKQFVWEKQWYPFAVEEHTDKTKSQALHLLGNDVVLWFDTKQWRVFEDACPHRGVPLSEGRVEKNGEMMCAYHAWTFDGEGKCTKIPQTKTAAKETALKAMPSSCVKSYPTMVAHGLIWVWGEKGILSYHQYTFSLNPFNKPSLSTPLSTPLLTHILSTHFLRSPILIKVPRDRMWLWKPR